jgi:WW domain
MSSNNLTRIPTSRPDKGASAAAAASTSTASSQVVGSHDAFRQVDDLVAKPTYGSDGARAWQTFRTSAVSDDGNGDAKRRIANANKPSSLGSAPLAPLKKLDRLLQFASWKDEVEHERSVRLQDGSAKLHSGYQLFHEKPQPKKKKSADDDGDDGGDGGGGGTTTTSRKRGGADDDATTQSAATTTAEESHKKKTKKKSKGAAAAVTMVDTPDHPLQQVAEAIRLRTAAAMAAAPAATTAAATASGGSGLLPGWEAAVDSATQQTYYYNRLTNQRQWTVPDPAAEAASASSSSKSTTRDATETADSASASGLPPGWVSVTDPTTRMEYYYHQETRETRWDRPGAA